MGMTKVLSTAGVTIASGSVTSASSGVATGAAAGAGANISSSVMGTAFGAVGALFATGIEAAFICKQWKQNRISTKEAFALGVISLLSNAATVAGGVGGAALGAKIGGAVGIVGGMHPFVFFQHKCLTLILLLL